MPGRDLSTLSVPQTWPYALLGGLVSMPLTIGQYWLSGLGNTFPMEMILVGGLLAGYLATKNATNGVRAGIGAGVIGGLPGYVWILPSILETATSFSQAWSSPLGAIVLLSFSLPAIIGLAVLPGWIGGHVGGWLARTVEWRAVLPGSI